MTSNDSTPIPAPPRRIAPTSTAAIFAGLALLASGTPAHASLFAGETLDAVANGVAWVAIVVGPIIGIVVFWLLHILPEKIAEKKKHPQTAAIQTLCLLSLFFGGLLWPIAWLWAYTKPVLYKMAYGVDEVEHHGTQAGKKEDAAALHADAPRTVAVERPKTVSEQVASMESERKARDNEAELERLRRELAELRRQLGRTGSEA